MWKNIDDGFTILLGVLFIIAGGVVQYFQADLFIQASKILGIALLLRVARSLITWRNNGKKKSHIVSIVLSTVIGLYFVFDPYSNLNLVFLIMGIYCYFDAAIKYITYYQYCRNKVPLRSILLMDAILFTVLGTMFFFTPLKIMDGFFIVLAVYLYLLGLRYIRDGIQCLWSRRKKTRMRSSLRINLPMVVSGLLPHSALTSLNKLLDKKEEVPMNIVKENVNPDLEVLIHVAPSGNNALGHVDLCLNGTVISYGNYDFTTYRMFDAIGDGVLFMAPKERYIRFCQKNNNKTLFGYGLKLTKEQMDNIYEKLESVKDNLYEWSPRAKADPEHQEEYTEYSSMLYKATKASFYKFKSGRFKSFFIMTTNCALFVESVLEKAGFDRLHINGAITPGTWFDYFEMELNKKDSIVNSKTVYRREDLT